MALHNFQAVANGVGTDHPIPDLPFVDDSHLPLDDPAAIEAIGRTDGTHDMQGRTDRIRPAGWVAYTTDPRRHDLAWVVRWHPEHGRSVMLYRDRDAASVYMTLWTPALLFRSGGYWWDGTTWYRPSQIFDRASGAYVRRAVPAATTVHAADLLEADGGSAEQAAVLDIVDVDVDEPRRPGRWRDALAAWAARRRADAPPLQQCVVQFHAPELAADQLISVAQLAEIAGIGASTLRAYLARGEGEIPAPQATPGGRSMWSLPVAEEWAEQRRNSPDGAAEVMAADDSDLPVGVGELWQRFTRYFVTDLWEHPGRRKRWALRWRTEPAVHDIAQHLGWTVAASLDRIVPLAALADTLHHAVLDELANGQRLDAAGGGHTSDPYGFYGVVPHVAEMLAWLIRHDPYRATGVINDIVGDAEHRLKISRTVTINSLRTALSLAGGDEQRYRDFLERALPPQ